jgi:uncharacterized membrane protein YeaQ/YmgE (transglycosylase-associated protein family)
MVVQGRVELVNKKVQTSLKGGEQIMGLLLWVIFGALAGWVASIVMKTDASQGLLMDIVLGVVGAVVGGLVMNFFGQEGVTGFNLYSLIVAVLGAMLVIWLGRMLRSA